MLTALIFAAILPSLVQGGVPSAALRPPVYIGPGKAIGPVFRKVGSRDRERITEVNGRNRRGVFLYELDLLIVEKGGSVVAECESYIDPNLELTVDGSTEAKSYRVPMRQGAPDRAFGRVAGFAAARRSGSVDVVVPTSRFPISVRFFDVQLTREIGAPVQIELASQRDKTLADLDVRKAGGLRAAVEQLRKTIAREVKPEGSKFNVRITDGKGTVHFVQGFSVLTAVEEADLLADLRDAEREKPALRRLSRIIAFYEHQQLHRVLAECLDMVKDGSAPVEVEKLAAGLADYLGDDDAQERLRRAGVGRSGQ